MDVHDCDVCGDPDWLSVKLSCPNTKFRKITEVCTKCFGVLESIRMRHASNAWFYGKADWKERLDRGVKKEVKKFYRKHGK